MDALIDSEMDLQTNRQKDGWTDGQTGTDRQVYTQTDGQIETDRWKDKQTERCTDR